jgi:chromate transporter
VNKMSSKQLTQNKLKMILSFIKVGLIGFGGGSALIPIIEKEVVQKTGVISQDEYTKHTIIANITPGTLPTKLGALSTTYTSLSGAYALTIPGVFLIIFLLSIISSIGSSAIHYIEYASVGISTFIIFLLVEYIVKVMRNGQAINKLVHYISIMLLSFFVTGGKEVRSIISILIGNKGETLLTPILDIATINLMITAFFIILFLGANITKIKIIMASCISVIYIVAVGKSSPFPAIWNLPLIIHVIMVLMIIISLYIDIKQSNKGENIQDKSDKTTKKIIRNMIFFTILPVTLLIIALVVTPKHPLDNNLSVVSYGINSAISTMSSFGGGEAFISIAEGFFVEPGYVPTNLYYSQIVSIANALPGPILVKVIAAAGLQFGIIHYGSTALGILFAALGTSIAVSISAIIALIVLLFFDKLKSSPRLGLIQGYILPVVCGMLISTSLAMFYESQKILVNSIGNTAIIPGSILILLLYLLIDRISNKFKWKDLFVLLFSAGLTLGSFLLVTNI